MFDFYLFLIFLIFHSMHSRSKRNILILISYCITSLIIQRDLNSELTFRYINRFSYQILMFLLLTLCHLVFYYFSKDTLPLRFELSFIKIILIINMFFNPVHLTQFDQSIFLILAMILAIFYVYLLSSHVLFRK